MGAVDEAARGVATRPDEVTQDSPSSAAPAAQDSPGGLAAFYAQPTGEDHAQEDDPGATVAAFYAQPSEDEPADAEPGMERDPLPDIALEDIVAHLGERFGGIVTALIVAIDGEEQPRVFEVPR